MLLKHTSSSTSKVCQTDNRKSLETRLQTLTCTLPACLLRIQLTTEISWDAMFLPGARLMDLIRVVEIRLAANAHHQSLGLRPTIYIEGQDIPLNSDTQLYSTAKASLAEGCMSSNLSLDQQGIKFFSDMYSLESLIETEKIEWLRVPNSVHYSKCDCNNVFEGLILLSLYLNDLCA
jgi:hypothetical protein